jgi:hypothetical protein
MPSRWVTLGIVAFWVATTLWLVWREGWQKASEPPPFTIDRTDEVGVQIANWDVRQGGRRVAQVRTRLGRNADDLLYDAACEYGHFDGFTYRGLLVRRFSSVYRVTPRGELRSLSCAVSLAGPLGPRLGAEIDWSPRAGGHVRHSHLGDALTGEQPAGRTTVFNLLHPLHKVAALSEGRRWRTEMLDPLATALPADAEPRGVPTGWLEAAVTAAALPWRGLEVECWRIDFREADGASPHARVWVRRRDNLVLRQEVYRWGTPVVLERRLLG